jgi:hypothetical protein
MVNYSYVSYPSLVGIISSWKNFHVVDKKDVFILVIGAKRD